MAPRQLTPTALRLAGRKGISVADIVARRGGRATSSASSLRLIFNFVFTEAPAR